MQDRYRFMGHVYDLVGTLYSARLIPRCKVAMIDRVRPGDRVLFAGAGHGKDAIQAADAGARVTVVDLSATRLRQFEKNTRNRSPACPIRRLHSDIMAVDEYDTFDFVFANFFLNVFKEDRMAAVLEHLNRLVKTGGHLVVGDFALPHGCPITRWLQKLHWYVAVMPFYLMTGNALHPVYDYPAHLMKGHSLTIVRPAIICSTMDDPFAGWVEGIKVIDVQIMGYALGKLKIYPALADATVDLIPPTWRPTR
jgi:demethylmenaquinone methyltransferase/2-methoxy-6-polyprenyl-1,4-benzoquinol methylase